MSWSLNPLSCSKAMRVPSTKFNLTPHYNGKNSLKKLKSFHKHPKSHQISTQINVKTPKKYSPKNF